LRFAKRYDPLRSQGRCRLAQRRFHYEQAFEHYLRANRVPYIAVDEAKKALLPKQSSSHRLAGGPELASLKSFDFVIYTPDRNLLIDVKGRMYGSAAGDAWTNPQSERRFESWVTQDDVDSLNEWQGLFGGDFVATFVFAYCLRRQPPDALFEELFAFNDRWYALREITLADYAAVMVPRSASWQTVHVPRAAFNRLSRPFSARRVAPETGCSRPGERKRDPCDAGV
jgi:hypothetical protein